MDDMINTPPGLEPSSDGVNEWIRYQLIRLHDRMKTIDMKVDALGLKQIVYDDFRIKTEIRLAEGVQKFISLDKQIEQIHSLKKSNPGNNENSITFKWLVEKFGTPVITSVVTAIIVAALVYWVTQGA